MVVFEKPKALTDVPLHYCPGCTHGIVHRLVAETIDEFGILGNKPPAGCHTASRIPTSPGDMHHRGKPR